MLKLYNYKHNYSVEILVYDALNGYVQYIDIDGNIYTTDINDFIYQEPTQV